MSYELNVTDFVNSATPKDYSASVAEIGNNAAADTWQAATEYASEAPLLQDAEQLAAAFAHFKAYGAWTASELSNETLQGLIVQELSACMREMQAYASYTEYQLAADNGQVSGNLYQGDNGEWYFYLGE